MDVLKVYGPIFQNIVLVSLKESSLQRCKFQISVETVKSFGLTKQILYIAVAYILLWGGLASQILSGVKYAFLPICMGRILNHYQNTLLMGSIVCRGQPKSTRGQIAEKYLIERLLYLVEARGGLNYFQVWVCGPDFRSVGLVNWSLPPQRGFVNWKFPKLGSCELKMSKFGVFWTENFQIWRLESENFGQNWDCRLKFPIFFLLWTDYCLKWDPCELLVAQMGPLRTREEARKGGLQGRTSPYPFLGQCPPPPGVERTPDQIVIYWWG